MSKILNLVFLLLCLLSLSMSSATLNKKSNAEITLEKTEAEAENTSEKESTQSEITSEKVRNLNKIGKGRTRKKCR